MIAVLRPAPLSLSIKGGIGRLRLSVIFSEMTFMFGFMTYFML